MCQIFVACSLNCPSYKILWHPTLLSCSLARDAARRSSRQPEVYPCGSYTTLWNEDLCPYCLTGRLRRGASKYVKECLVKWPLRYEPVFIGGRYLMRWVGRAREEFDIERRMERRSSTTKFRCCESKPDCKCYFYKSERRLSNAEYVGKKARQRSSARYYGRSSDPLYEKETYYKCKPTALRQEVEMVYECQPKEQKRKTETYYTCKATGSTERYNTTACPRTKTVYFETERERRKREKEDDRAHEKYNKSRRSSSTTTYRRNGYDIDVDVDVDVKERRPSSKKRKSVSFADEAYYYGYY